jgi:cytochrome c553
LRRTGQPSGSARQLLHPSIAHMNMPLSLALLALSVLPLAAAAQDKSQTTPPATAPGKTEDVRNYISMCTGCHTIPGYQASFPRVYRVPMISGQSAKYIEAALQGYKKGERNHPTMRAIAAQLTDQQIAALGEYYAGLGKK